MTSFWKTVPGAVFGPPLPDHAVKGQRLPVSVKILRYWTQAEAMSAMG